MLKIISSAILTIILSFVSGVLLDTYKNLAPRIVCSIGKGVSIALKNKKIRAYTLTVRNISNKTIHDLTLNVQGHYDNLKVDDANITKGLKFDVSNEDNNYSVSIPFLSKDDEFSVKLFVERIGGSYKKPVVTLRSPEDFKEIESEDQDGFMASLLSVPENISGFFKRKITHDKELDNNKSVSSFNNKKVIVAIASTILVIFIGVFAIQYYMDRNKDTGNNVKTTSSQQSNNESKQVSSPSNNSKSKAAADKSKTSNNGSSTEGSSNTSSGGKSSAPTNNKGAKQTTGGSESKSQINESNSESEGGTSDGEKNNNDLKNNNDTSGEGKVSNNPSTAKSGDGSTTKGQAQEKKTDGSKSGDGTGTNPSETKAN